jgi:hypothetical protein
MLLLGVSLAQPSPATGSREIERKAVNLLSIEFSRGLAAL